MQRTMMVWIQFYKEALFVAFPQINKEELGITCSEPLSQDFRVHLPSGSAAGIFCARLLCSVQYLSEEAEAQK